MLCPPYLVQSSFPGGPCPLSLLPPLSSSLPYEVLYVCTVPSPFSSSLVRPSCPPSPCSPHIPASRFTSPRFLFSLISQLCLLVLAQPQPRLPTSPDFLTDTLLDRTCSIRRDLSDHANCRYNLAGHGSISGPRYLSTTSAPPQHHLSTTSESLQIRSPPIVHRQTSHESLGHPPSPHPERAFLAVPPLCT